MQALTIVFAQSDAPPKNHFNGSIRNPDLKVSDGLYYPAERWDQDAARNLDLPVFEFANKVEPSSRLACSHHGVLLVANFKNNSVDMISAKGARGVFYKGAALQGPIAIAVGPDDEVYVANYSNSSIARISKEGRADIIASNIGKPTSLAVNDERLFFSREDSSAIYRIALIPELKEHIIENWYPKSRP